MDKRLVLIDGNSLINRAYYAMQKPMITKQGLYTQGVYGFLNMLFKIEKDYEPGYICIAFDRKAPTFRHLEYEQYKAGRKKMPPELAMQLPLLKEVLTAMKIKMIEIDGFEADDIIGTVAKRAEEQGLLPMVITGDKDELQLATKKTSVLITKKGISEFEIYDEDAMIDKYGFTPTQFIDYKGLMGDQSDNIPGLPGVGEKTAQKLLLDFGSIENLIANTDKIKNEKMRIKIEENAQLAVMSKRLATINTNIPIDTDFNDFVKEEPDYKQLIDIYVKLEFNSFLRRLPNNVTADNIESESEIKSDFSNEELEIVIVKSEEDIDNFREKISLRENMVLKVFSDNNHTVTPVIFGVAVLVEKTLYYMEGDNKAYLDSFCSAIFEANKKIIGHDLIKDYYALMSNFSGIQNINTGFDTAIGQYVLEPSRSKYDLKTMVIEYFHNEIPDEETFIANNGQIDFLSDTNSKYIDFAKKWCANVVGLAKVISERIKKEDLEKVYYEIELPLIEALADMEKQGIKVDGSELRDAGRVISEKLLLLSDEIYELAGEEFNINSPQQLGIILFEKLELPSGKKTKRGYSTGAEILEKLRDKHPIINLIFEYRMLAKLNSTYIEGLLPLIDASGRIHAHFQQTVTATGRISCTEPNLQNIPIRQEYGRRLRKAFIPVKENFCFIGADYSQIELRVLAHMSKDQHLIEAFNNGADIHRATASKVFGIPWEEVTSLQRSNAKAVNFGVIYGMSSFGLSTELNITRKEAEKYINDYFQKYAKVKEFMDEQKAFCKENGFIRTIMDRKRHIPEITASNFMVRQLGERLAMNSPIQGSAADIIKIAMINVYKRLLNEKLEAKLVLQVHDELIIEAPKSEADIIKKLLVEEMEKAVELQVKLVVDVNIADNWYELK